MNMGVVFVGVAIVVAMMLKSILDDCRKADARDAA
jgi:hypothetical protein